MKIKLVSESTVTVVTRKLIVDEKRIDYIEYQNDNGRVIDEELKSANGDTIHDEDMLEAIQKMFP